MILWKRWKISSLGWWMVRITSLPDSATRFKWFNSSREEDASRPENMQWSVALKKVCTSARFQEAQYGYQILRFHAAVHQNVETRKKKILFNSTPVSCMCTPYIIWDCIQHDVTISFLQSSLLTVQAWRNKWLSRVSLQARFWLV